jgi:CUB domain
LQFLQLDFNYFDTEACCDLVILFDGDSAKDTRIALLSGTYPVPPKGYLSTQRYMFVRFRSDESTVASGFSATYMSIGEIICFVTYFPLSHEI